MNYAAAQFFFNVFIFLWAGGFGLYTWLVNRQRANQADIEEINRRMATFEERIRTMPDHDDLSQIYERMNVIHGELKEMSGSFRAVTQQLTLISQHLMEKDR